MKQADKWFSLYVRLRDSDENGIGACITCGRRKHYKLMDCGHYIKRQFKSCRFNERNCNLQCKYCNAFLQGDNEEYAKAIEKKWGKSALQMLHVKYLTDKRTPTKYYDFELQAIAEHYKGAVNEIIK